MKSALEPKRKYPQIQVNVYDAKERVRTLVEQPTNRALLLLLDVRSLNGAVA